MKRASKQQRVLGWVAAVVMAMGGFAATSEAGHDEPDRKSVQVRVNRGPFSFKIGFRNGRFVPTIVRHAPVHHPVVHHYRHAPKPKPVCTITRCVHKDGYRKCGVVICKQRYTRECEAKARTKAKAKAEAEARARARAQAARHHHVPSHHAHSGWDLLAEGRTHAAARAFERVLSHNPYGSMPRVGLAIARAKLGDEAGAVQAMRRAVFYDVDVLKRVAMGREVRAIVHQLAHHTSGHAATHRSSDLRFLAAAFYATRGDYAAARTQIHRATALGDGAVTTRQLHRMIEEKLNPPTYHQRDHYTQHGGHNVHHVTRWSRH
jgi:hypothetical protein